MPPIDLATKRVLVLGAKGLVGAALVKRLVHERLALLFAFGRDPFDLRSQADVRAVFERTRPDVVFLAAARVGGILANRDRPAEFAYDNLSIALNVVEASRMVGVQKLVFLGSSCIYPRDASQPIGEDALLTGPLEETNRSYAVAKIAGIELCRAYRRQYGCDFVSIMPPNIYGERDHFDDERGSHVMAALIRRIVQAKRGGAGEITIWGTGAPRREFMHAADLADAAVFVAKNYSDEAPINVGWGRDISIRELAGLIAEAAGWRGEIRTDPSKPDGTPRKVLDTTKIAAMGWRPEIDIRSGVARVLQAYERSLS